MTDPHESHDASISRVIHIPARTSFVFFSFFFRDTDRQTFLRLEPEIFFFFVFVGGTYGTNCQPHIFNLCLPFNVWSLYTPERHLPLDL